MSTLNRNHTALLIVDVQNGVVKKAHQRDLVVANIGALVDKARRDGAAVVWVQHASDELPPGGEAWRIVPELNPDAREPLIDKRYGDSFEETALERVLSDLGVGRLVWSEPRPTPASARPCTGRWCAAMT
jgi:nicotinamidase-related amidase